MIALANEARPENSVATDERIRGDLARLLQERLVRESRLGVWVHPILIAVIVALAWPDAPQTSCSAGPAPSCSPRCSEPLGCLSPHAAR